MNQLSLNEFQWVRCPQQYERSEDSLIIITQPNTDLWQRTYYGFQNDNAPVFLMETGERYFSFLVKTQFESTRRFDQCGIALYQDSENWLKASIEYENSSIGRLGSVVTNHGYSDWATTDIDAGITSMYYRLSRRESDFCIEVSEDGTAFHQMRICHLWEGSGTIRFGVYACSPENSSFRAVFREFQLTQCQWREHQPSASL